MYLTENIKKLASEFAQFFPFSNKTPNSFFINLEKNEYLKNDSFFAQKNPLSIGELFPFPIIIFNSKLRKETFIK